jgi:hypothetical protein
MPLDRMLLVDQPYVSNLLRHTIQEHSLPVVLTPTALELGMADAPGAITEDQARLALQQTPHPWVLTNSENALGWLAANAPAAGLPHRADLFKNKLAFRRLLREMHPDFRFREVTPDQLDRIDPEEVGHPFVLKPAVGFFSLGVQMVNNSADWPEARRTLQAYLSGPKANYPDQVLDTRTLILEEIITGTEYAVDAYYDEDGHPVITNILQHLFSSEADVSDRVYMTGEQIVRDNLARFGAYLEQVGRLADLRNFPVHVEVRVDDEDRILPIEFNPLRCGGWCTTADLTALAYDFNPYVEFLRKGAPDWDEIFSSRGESIFSLVVLNNSTGLAPEQIPGFDLQTVGSRFTRCLDLRSVDYHRYPLFGFVLAETPADNTAELEAILHSDLREFVLPAP